MSFSANKTKKEPPLRATLTNNLNLPTLQTYTRAITSPTSLHAPSFASRSTVPDSRLFKLRHWLLSITTAGNHIDGLREPSLGIVEILLEVPTNTHTSPKYPYAYVWASPSPAPAHSAYADSDRPANSANPWPRAASDSLSPSPSARQGSAHQ